MEQIGADGAVACFQGCVCRLLCSSPSLSLSLSLVRLVAVERAQPTEALSCGQVMCPKYLVSDALTQTVLFPALMFTAVPNSPPCCHPGPPNVPAKVLVWSPATESKESKSTRESGKGAVSGQDARGDEAKGVGVLRLKGHEGVIFRCLQACRLVQALLRNRTD